MVKRRATCDGFTDMKSFGFLALNIENNHTTASILFIQNIFSGWDNNFLLPYLKCGYTWWNLHQNSCQCVVQGVTRVALWHLKANLTLQYDTSNIYFTFNNNISKTYL